MIIDTSDDQQNAPELPAEESPLVAECPRRSVATIGELIAVGVMDGIDAMMDLKKRGYPE